MTALNVGDAVRVAPSQPGLRSTFPLVGIVVEVGDFHNGYTHVVKFPDDDATYAFQAHQTVRAYPLDRHGYPIPPSPAHDNHGTISA